MNNEYTIKQVGDVWQVLKGEDVIGVHNELHIAQIQCTKETMKAVNATLGTDTRLNEHVREMSIYYYLLDKQERLTISNEDLADYLKLCKGESEQWTDLEINFYISLLR